FLHGYLNPAVGYQHVPVQNVSCGQTDVRIVPLAGVGKIDLELDGERFNTRQPFHRLLGSRLFSQASHSARQCHHAVLDRDSDVGGVHTRLPPEFVENICLQFPVTFHGWLFSFASILVIAMQAPLVSPSKRSGLSITGLEYSREFARFVKSHVEPPLSEMACLRQPVARVGARTTASCDSVSFRPRDGAIKFVRTDRRAFSRGRRSNHSVRFVRRRSCRRIRCNLIPQGGTNLRSG